MPPEVSVVPAEASGTSPEASGTSPEASGTSPEASGTSPEASGTSSEASGTPPEASGTPSEALKTHSEALKTHSEALKTHSEALKKHSEALNTHPGPPDMSSEEPQTGPTAKPVKSVCDRCQDANGVVRELLQDDEWYNCRTWWYYNIQPRKEPATPAEKHGLLECYKRRQPEVGLAQKKFYTDIAGMLIPLATFAGAITLATQFITKCQNSRMQVLLTVASLLFLATPLALVPVYLLLYGLPDDQIISYYSQRHALVCSQLVVSGIMLSAAFLVLGVAIYVSELDDDPNHWTDNRWIGVCGLALLSLMLLASIVPGLLHVRLQDWIPPWLRRWCCCCCCRGRHSGTSNESQGGKGKEVENGRDEENGNEGKEGKEGENVEKNGKEKKKERGYNRWIWPSFWRGALVVGVQMTAICLLLVVGGLAAHHAKYQNGCGPTNTSTP